MKSMWHHKKRVHEKLRPHKCFNCGASFASKRDLNTHIYNNHGNVQEKSHQCQTCEKTFKLKSNLDKHIYFIHGKVTMVKCNFCDKECTTKKGLEIHISTKHGINVKEFKCDMCHKEFL